MLDELGLTKRDSEGYPAIAGERQADIASSS